jgi:hypothetical protein
VRGFRAATRFREMDELLTLDDADRPAEKVVLADAWGYSASGEMCLGCRFPEEITPAPVTKIGSS